MLKTEQDGRDYAEFLEWLTVYMMENRVGLHQETTLPMFEAWQGAMQQARSRQPEQDELVAQPFGDLTGVRPCCGDYANCHRPCTPRGRVEERIDADRRKENEYIAVGAQDYVDNFFAEKGFYPSLFQTFWAGYEAKRQPSQVLPADWVMVSVNPTEYQMYSGGKTLDGLMHKLAASTSSAQKAGMIYAQMVEDRPAASPSKAPQGEAWQWGDWHGSECPVDENVMVKVRYRNGFEDQRIAGSFRWYQYGTGKGSPQDIVAYATLLKATQGERKCPKCGADTHFASGSGHVEARIEICDECQWQGEPE